MRNYRKLRLPEHQFGNYLLREISVKDYKDMFEYGSNPKVTEYLNWGPFYLQIEAKRSIKSIFIPRLKRGLPIGYAIIDLIKNKMIGTIDFHTKNEDDQSVEIGYALHQDYWNQGIMTYALKYLIDLGFNYFNYRKLRIRHMEGNIGSEKIIAKTPFRFTEETIYQLKKIHDRRLVVLKNYELTKEEYDEYQQS
ncbi:MAG: GNAT family N-acetyltransferase [Acholeplasmataceae bacterium]